MGRTKIHVTPTHDGDWRVKRVGAERATKVFENKADAIKLAKK